MYTAITIITPFLLMFIFITYLNKKNKGKIPFETSNDDWGSTSTCYNDGSPRILGDQDVFNPFHGYDNFRYDNSPKHSNMNDD